VFGTLFNDISVQRIDRQGNIVQTIPVPIAYGPKEKWLVRINNDELLDQSVRVTSPRIGFEITSFSYDGGRQKIFEKNRKKLSTDGNKLISQYTPTPWNINFTLSVFVKNADDGTQIVEQIVPYFRPEWNVSMNLIPELQDKKDIAFVLNSVSPEDTYEGDYESRRALIWNFDFTCKAWYYGPISNRGIIKRSIIDINNIDSNKLNARVDVQPGLTANNEPTIYANNSINIDLISATDPFGYVVDIDEDSGD
jgi:hypothetical protein